MTSRTPSSSGTGNTARQRRGTGPTGQPLPTSAAGEARWPGSGCATGRRRSEGAGQDQELAPGAGSAIDARRRRLSGTRAATAAAPSEMTASTINEMVKPRSAGYAGPPPAGRTMLAVTMVVVTMLVVTCPPSALPRVLILAFIPVATPVCPAGTDSTITLGLLE